MRKRIGVVAVLLAAALSFSALPASGAGYRPLRGSGHGWSGGFHDRTDHHGGWGFYGRYGSPHRGWDHGHWDGYLAYGFAGPLLVYDSYAYGYSDAYPYRSGDRGFLGSLLGAVTGGLLGSTIGRGAGNAAAIAGGAVLGALVGGSVGHTMDELDRQYVAQTLEYVPSHRVTAWQNPDTRTRYQVEPLRTYQRQDGQYCREYQTKALIGGEWQQVYGTACRQPDGSWEVQP